MFSPVTLVTLLLAGPQDPAAVEGADRDRPVVEEAAAAPVVAEPVAPPADAPIRAVAPEPVELTEAGQLVSGGRALSPREFYALAGRGDLVERGDRNLTARRWLFGSSAVVLVAAVTLGIVFLSLVPDINQPYCLSGLARYEQCVAARDLYDRSGVLTLAGGAAAAAVLAGLGLTTRPDVLSRWELDELVTRYNEDHADREGR
jgi:hypothetical protein